MLFTWYYYFGVFVCFGGGDLLQSFHLQRNVIRRDTGGILMSPVYVCDYMDVCVSMRMYMCVSILMCVCVSNLNIMTKFERVCVCPI